MKHSVLGARLIECIRLVLKLKSRSAEQIFGNVDAMKFHSSMTLFADVSLQETAFQDALEQYFDGVQDEKTLELLE